MLHQVGKRQPATQPARQPGRQGGRETTDSREMGPMVPMGVHVSGRLRGVVAGTEAVGGRRIRRAATQCRGQGPAQQGGAAQQLQVSWHVGTHTMAGVLGGARVRLVVCWGRVLGVRLG
jgi:hypothetical protein